MYPILGIRARARPSRYGRRAPSCRLPVGSPQGARDDAWRSPQPAPAAAPNGSAALAVAAAGARPQRPHVEASVDAPEARSSSAQGRGRVARGAITASARADGPTAPAVRAGKCRARLDPTAGVHPRVEGRDPRTWRSISGMARDPDAPVDRFRAGFGCEIVEAMHKSFASADPTGFFGYSSSIRDHISFCIHDDIFRFLVTNE